MLKFRVALVVRAAETVKLVVPMAMAMAVESVDLFRFMVDPP